MPIVYNKLFELLRMHGIPPYRLKTEKVIGSASFDKLRKEEGHIDTRTIERLCAYLHCQPGDIMEYVEE